MRPLGLFALVAPFALLAFACEQDPSSSPGGLQLPDAGGVSLPDSSTPIPDAAAPDAPRPTGVTVTVVRQGAPQANVRVLFHDATGAVTGDFRTDATGAVTQAAAPNMVTVLAPRTDDELAPVTYLGVADGDALTVDVGSEPTGEPTPLGNYEVTFAGGFDDAYGYTVQASSACGSPFGTAANETFALTLYPECLGAQGAVLASAHHENGHSLAFSFAKNLAKPAAGSTVTVPTLPAFAAGASLGLSAPNLPDVYAWSGMTVIAGGLPFDVGEPSGDLHESSLTFKVPVGFADAYQAALTTYAGVSTLTVVKREPATVNSIALDYASMLPALDEPTLDTGNPKRPKATWSASAPLNGAAGGVLEIRWSGSSYLQWRFVLPPGTTEVTVPALPTDATIPPVDGGIFVSDLAFVAATHLANYKPFKSLPMPSYEEPSFLSVSTTLPATGTVRTTRLRGRD